MTMSGQHMCVRMEMEMGLGWELMLGADAGRRTMILIPRRSDRSSLSSGRPTDLWHCSLRQNRNRSKQSLQSFAPLETSYACVEYRSSITDHRSTTLGYFHSIRHKNRCVVVYPLKNRDDSTPHLPASASVWFCPKKPQLLFTKS